jgi:hypothetical protein
MIWLTWRQFRTQATVIYTALVFLTLLLAVTGPQLADLYAPWETACSTGSPAPTGPCTTSDSRSSCSYRPSSACSGARRWSPASWRPAPTASRGTRASAAPAGSRPSSLSPESRPWQPRHWPALAVTWWSGPIDQAVNSGGTGADPFYPRIDPLVFGARGVVPIGHAAFAFILGVTLGVLVRRTVPAMAATLATYAAVQIVMPLWVRPHLAASVQASLSFTEAKPVTIGVDSVQQVDFGQPGAWVLSEQTVNASGDPAPLPTSFTDCPSMSDCAAALNEAGYRQEVVYQPAGNFWTLQWAETGIFLGLALALAGFCAWWIRRRTV